MKTKLKKTNESFADMEKKKNKFYSTGKITEAREVQSKLDFLYFGIKI
jgi:hypothetical protein